jgi:hypothetical protein
VTIAIRPEDIEVNAQRSEAKGNFLEGEIDALLFVGDRLECHIKIGIEAILVYAPRYQNLEEGMKVHLYFPPEVLSVWPLL